MRGKVLGGSSSINVMAYVRGHRGDYDRWAQNGCRGWSYAEVLPYFKRCESWEKGENAWRGGHGPLLRHRLTQSRSAVRRLARRRAQEADWPFTEDYNGKEQEGFGLGQWTIRNGRRCSAAVAFPAARRCGGPTSPVETNAPRDAGDPARRDRARSASSTPAAAVFTRRWRPARCCWPAACSTRRSCSCCRGSVRPTISARWASRRG